MLNAETLPHKTTTVIQIVSKVKKMKCLNLVWNVCANFFELLFVLWLFYYGFENLYLIF